VRGVYVVGGVAGGGGGWRVGAVARGRSCACRRARLLLLCVCVCVRLLLLLCLLSSRAVLSAQGRDIECPKIRHNLCCALNYPKLLNKKTSQNALYDVCRV